jgi:hypothetical protein
MSLIALGVASLSSNSSIESERSGMKNFRKAFEITLFVLKVA